MIHSNHILILGQPHFDSMIYNFDSRKCQNESQKSHFASRPTAFFILRYAILIPGRPHFASARRAFDYAGLDFDS